MELEQELRATSDDVMRVLEQLQQLEQRKRETAPGTPTFERLANEIERVAALMFSQTHAQQALVERTAAVVKQTGEPLTPIEDVTVERDVGTILAEWREAERRLTMFAIESAEHTQAAADVRRLRDEYHRYHQSQLRGGKPKH